MQRAGGGRTGVQKRRQASWAHRQDRVRCKISSELGDVRRLGAALTFHDIKFYLLSFFERTVTVAVDRGIMDEHVVAAIHTNEAVPLFAVKPLHSSLHCLSPPTVVQAYLLISVHL